MPSLPGQRQPRQRPIYMQRKWPEAAAWQAEVGGCWGRGGLQGACVCGSWRTSQVRLAHLWCLQDAAKQEEGRGGCQVRAAAGATPDPAQKRMEDSPVMGRCIPHQTRPDLHLRNRGSCLLALWIQLVLGVIPGLLGRSGLSAEVSPQWQRIASGGLPGSRWPLLLPSWGDPLCLSFSLYKTEVITLTQKGCWAVK